MRKIMNLMFLMILVMLSGITSEAFAQNVADSLDIEAPANPTAMQLEEHEAEVRASVECLAGQSEEFCMGVARRAHDRARRSFAEVPEELSAEEVKGRLRWSGAEIQAIWLELECLGRRTGLTEGLQDLQDQVQTTRMDIESRLTELESRVTANEETIGHHDRRIDALEAWQGRVEDWRIDFEDRNGLQKIRFAGGVVIGMDLGQPIEGGPAAADGTPNLIRGPSTTLYGAQLVPGYWFGKRFAVDLPFSASWTADSLSNGFSWSAGMRPVYSGPKGLEAGGTIAVGQTMYGIRDDVAGASADMMPELKLGGIIGYRAGGVYVSVEGYARQGWLQNHRSGNAGKARFGGVMITVGASVR